jgi:hypothetical protein
VHLVLIEFGRTSYMGHLVSIMMCSVGVRNALLALVRMGSSAGPAQQAVFIGLTNTMNNMADALAPMEGSTPPTAAEVPCPIISSFADPQHICRSATTNGGLANP